MSKAPLYAIGAEFDEASKLLEAAQKTWGAGYRRLDACSPFPIHHLAEAIGFHSHHDRVPLCVFVGGVIGGFTGFFMQMWASTQGYAYNIGGRPLASWPAFIPATFEMTVLFGALAGVISMFTLNGLPEPYHPYFNAPQFEAATRDRFFLFVMSDDPNFEQSKVHSHLQGLGALSVFEVNP